MLYVSKVIEIVDSEEIKKLRMITKDNEYCEVRLKDNGWLDVRMSKNDNEGMRMILKEKIDAVLSIEEIIKHVGIIFL